MAKQEKVYLAVDLGASGGRVLAGRFDGSRLRLDEIHRFDNGPVSAAGNMYWNLLRLWSEIKLGLRQASDSCGPDVVSVGVDTWGVDFGLLGADDELLGNPYHYRDRRTVGVMDLAFQTVSREEIFAETGVQFMELNTLYQLLAMKRAGSPLLDQARSLLMIPDLFHWLLTGTKANEITNATTTQMFNPTTNAWSAVLLERFGLPDHLLGQLLPAGTRLGPLRTEVADETSLAGVDVVLPGTHDTASAVMAVPAQGISSGWCYISSGTWSLMGIESPGPVINETCSQLNFTNEGGVGGTNRLLKNIAGLWLIQECRRIWALEDRDYGWDELIRRADESPALVSLIHPDDASFVAPQDMPEAIRAYCRSTKQPVPEEDGAVVRCALESLALRYRVVLGWLERLRGGRIETIHIVGGGALNRLLCQMTADATGRRVVAGPVEATAIGNVMMQVVASGEVGSIAESREVVQNSFSVTQYDPRETKPWDEAFTRFERFSS